MTPARSTSRGTARGRKRAAASAAEQTAPEQDGAAETAMPESPRRSARRTVMDVVMQLPNYLRLLFGLITDRRVEPLDKALVIGAIAYILSPLDLVPDFLPFFGQVDDAFLLISAIERLISNAGRKVILAHWHGDPADLSPRALRLALIAASFFLPRRIRRRLRGLAA